ncbi:MAG: hypothetical protein ACI9MR_001968 [Myxococcota bacterium]
MSKQRCVGVVLQRRSAHLSLFSLISRALPGGVDTRRAPGTPAHLLLGEHPRHGPTTGSTTMSAALVGWGCVSSGDGSVTDYADAELDMGEAREEDIFGFKGAL